MVFLFVVVGLTLLQVASQRTCFLLRIGGNKGHKEELMAPNDSPVNIDALAIYMQRKLDDLPPLKGDDDLCIYRVNQKFRKINPYAFIPEIVSIGPFHHKQESLLAMKEHKLHCLKTILATKPGIQECIAHMAELLVVTRDCYESIKLDKNAFIEMMILDGIFIIDLFKKYRSGQENYPGLKHLCTNIASLKRDILLLENQLPMSVLVNLLQYFPTGSAGSSSSTINHDTLISAESYATKLSLRFFNGLIMPKTNGPESTSTTLKGKHLLDLLGKTLHPLSPKWPSINYPKTSKSVPCVTELRRAGVKFKRGSSTSRLLDINYSDGTIEIPPIVIHDLTETLLRNLIAYEQCSHQKENYMISYAFFMDSLINSEEDVLILCEKEIVENTLGNNREVCNIFNTLCNEATLENFYYSDTCDMVNKYYNIRWNRQFATLKRDYFQTPWTRISFGAAVLLLILTIIQAVTSILQVTDNKTTDIDFGTSARDWLVKLLHKNNITNITSN